MELNKITNRHRLTLTIPGGGNNGQFFFQNNSTLRSDITREVITTGIKVFGRPQLDATGTEPPGPPILQFSNFGYCQFTLVESDGQQRIVNMPLTEICQVESGIFGTQAFFQQIPEVFEPRIIDWAQSYVTIAGAPPGTIAAGGNRIIFGVDFYRGKPGTLTRLRAAAALAGSKILKPQY